MQKQLNASMNPCKRFFVNAKEQNEKGHYGPRGSYQNFDYQLPWNQLEEIDYIYTKGFRNH